MNTKPPVPSTPADPPGGDPSMEDILASIRRILSEDEAQPAAVPPPSADAAPAPAGPVPAIPQPPHAGPPEAARGARSTGTPDVLVLDSSMLVQETPVTPPDPMPAPPSPPRPAEPPQVAPARAPAQPTGDVQPSGGVQPDGAGSVQPSGPAQPPVMAKLPAPPPPSPPGQLVAPEAASAVGTLMRTLAAERGAAVNRGGPTIEELVREELRPMLKAWLDTYLPPLVERLVRAEIERVVGHTAP